MEIKNIVFDFGGVLVDWDPRYLYRTIFDDHSEMEYFLKNICTEAWNIQQDAGRTLAEGTAILIKQFPGYKTMIQHFYDRWEVMLKGEIIENVNVLYKLKDKYRLFGLTNWSGETFPIAYNKYDFFKELEGIVVSGDEKKIKPGNDIFFTLLERYQIQANNSLFIDDNINNINAAKKIGFQTVHFSNGLNLQTHLEQINIL